MRILKVLTIVCLATTTVALAQEEQAEEQLPATEEELVLAEEIATQTTAFVGTIKELATMLASLPDDMKGMTEVYDGMIASVDKMLLEVAEDSALAKGITGLRATSEEKRAEWQKVCDETENKRDCSYVTEWDKRVGRAIEQEKEFSEIVREMTNARDIIVSNRRYGIADLELRIFDRAQEGLDQSIAQMRVIAASMTQLAVQVGGPEFAGQETN
jgi:hypothetical protein